MSHATPGAARAAVQGLALAFRAPGLIAAIVLITIITAVPFALAIEGPVMDSLAVQPPVSTLSASEVDAEWWQEFRRHASGLVATFTPAILGFAAPLETVSAVLDGTPRPLALAAPIAISAIIWAWLWGGILHRFATGVSSPRAFIAAARRHFVPMLGVSVVAATVSLLLYVTIHPLLGAVYDLVAPQMTAERNAFVVRVVVYVVFGAALMIVNAVFSFARIAMVTGGERRWLPAMSSGWTFVRTHLTSVTALYVIFFVVFAAAMVAYGAAETLGGARVGGWRAVAIGQMFIVFRIGLRIAFSGAQVRLAAPATRQ